MYWATILMIILGVISAIAIPILIVLIVKKPATSSDLSTSSSGSTSTASSNKPVTSTTSTTTSTSSTSTSQTPAPQGDAETVPALISKFPPNIQNSILILNSTASVMAAYFSPDLAFYGDTDSATDPSTGSTYADYWAKCKATFTVYSPGANGTWTSSAKTGTYFQSLNPGECWVVTLPLSRDGVPVTCNGYRAGASGNCTGTTIWVENQNQNTRATDSFGVYRLPNTSIIEAYFPPKAGDNINYDFSAVDGINFTAHMYCGQSSSTDAPDSIKKCDGVTLDTCPSKESDIDSPIGSGFKNCYSPKHYLTKDTSCSLALNSDCYGCGEDGARSDLDKFKSKCQCHKVWDPQSAAAGSATKDWRNYLGKCAAYTWAYDEQFLKSTDTSCMDLTDTNADIYDTNSISLQTAPNAPGINLFVNITSVFGQ